MIDTVYEHYNSEHERITIERVTSGDYCGSLVLVIHDDKDQGATAAPMLLDRSTRDWLLVNLKKIDGS